MRSRARGLGAAEAVLLAAPSAVWWRRGRPGLRSPRRARRRRALRDPLVVGFARRRRRRARVRAPARLHGAAEQLGLADLPPRARRVLGAARRRLLGPERPDRPDQRVPAARRAGGPLPLRRDRQRRALRAAAARSRCSRRWRRSTRGAPARVRRSAPPRAPALLFADVHDRRARGDDLAERPRRRVAPGRGGGVPARARRGRRTALAGLAAGLALGVKLTTGARAPGAAPARARRAAAGPSRSSPASGVARVRCVFGSSWGYVLNSIETGRLLGHGGGRVELGPRRRSPAASRPPCASLYRRRPTCPASTTGRSGCSPGSGRWRVAVLGARSAGPALGARARRRRDRGAAARAGARARPRGRDARGRPARPPADEPGRRQTSLDVHWAVNRLASEDFAGYGPLGLAVVAVPVGRDRRRGPRPRRRAAARARRSRCRASSCCSCSRCSTTRS